MSIEAAQRQPKRRARLIRTERTIIPRPRLIKRLDRSRARTILLLAPAGFGKTTLARQWRETLTRAVTLSLTPAHRDVTVIARDLARSIEAAGVDGYVAFMEQYILARSSPQSEAASIGRALADGLEKARTEWLIVDDYHDVATTPEAEELIETVLAQTSARFLVATRVRPSWAQERKSLYGEVEVLTRKTLAMDIGEAQTILGRPGRLARQVIAMADGWPVVLALAAPLDFDLPEEIRPDALHQFLAEEFIEALSSAGQRRLTEVALLPETQKPFGGLPEEDAKLLRVILDDGRDLHRLLREFLLERVAESPDRAVMVTEACDIALADEHWERVFELIERFEVDHLIEDAAQRAFEVFLRSGSIWRLVQFVRVVNKRVVKPSGVLVLVEAEAAWGQGQIELLAPLARRAARLLGPEHRFYSHAAFLEARALFYAGDVAGARNAFVRAKETSQTERDLGEALLGLATASIHGENGAEVVGQGYIQELRDRQDTSIDDLMRYLVVAHAHSIYHGPVALTPFVQEAVARIEHSEDKWRASSILFNAAYALMLRAEYDRAEQYAARMRDIVDQFDIQFARPYMQWVSAAVNIGLRHIPEANRDLAALAKQVAEVPMVYHDLNVRVLKARQLLGTGRSEEALAYVQDHPSRGCVASMRAEYYSTRAMVSAALGDGKAHQRAAQIALSLSRAPDARAQVAASFAIASASRGDEDALVRAFAAGSRVDAWDPFVCALRGSATLAVVAAATPRIEPMLRTLCERSGDLRLARKLGVRLAYRPPRTSVLSERETEILGLLAQGMRSDEIARTLFISGSTVKVHVHHILEKLGVRTRAQAVAVLVSEA